jgi:hypothetical protein
MGVSGRRALSETLAKVRTRIRQLHERGDRVGEEDTKAIVIEPVLAALGWQLDELDEVRREYRFKSQDGPVGYALLVFGQPRLFVEAKALGMPLDRRCASQIIGYALVVGVGWCLLTNGDEYRLYNSHALVDVEEKLFRTMRLSAAEQEAPCLETLELFAKERMGETELDALWESQFVDRHVKAALEELFSGEDPGLGRFIHRKAPELSLSEVRESLRRANIHVRFPEVPLPSAAPEPAVALPVHPPLGSRPAKSPRIWRISSVLASSVHLFSLRRPTRAFASRPRSSRTDRSTGRRRATTPSRLPAAWLASPSLVHPRGAPTRRPTAGPSGSSVTRRPDSCAWSMNCANSTCSDRSDPPSATRDRSGLALASGWRHQRSAAKKVLEGPAREGSSLQPCERRAVNGCSQGRKRALRGCQQGEV